MMKWLKRIAVVVVVLLVAILAVLHFQLGAIVKTAVEQAGPQLAGVPMKLDHARVRLLTGDVRLEGFELGNPEGFKTERAISVGKIVVDLSVRSLLTDTIVIRKIQVSAPEITYELGLGKSNIGRILEQMSGPESEQPAPAAPEEQQAPEKAAQGGKKVIIEDFLIEDGKVKLSATLTQGVAAPIPLPTVHLTDIGKESDGKGASPLEVIRKIMGAVVSAVTDVATGSVKAMGDGVKAVGDGAKAAGQGAVDAVGKGATAVGKGAGEAAEAVGAGAGKIVDGVKGLFGGSGDDDKSDGK